MHRRRAAPLHADIHCSAAVSYTTVQPCDDAVICMDEDYYINGDARVGGLRIDRTVVEMTEEGERWWPNTDTDDKEVWVSVRTKKGSTKRANISKYLETAVKRGRAKAVVLGSETSGLFLGDPDGELADRIRKSDGTITELDSPRVASVIENGAGLDQVVELTERLDVAKGIIMYLATLDNMEEAEFSPEQEEFIGSLGD